MPTIVYSQNATITPASGQAQDFSQPVTYKVKNNSAESTYTVTVIAIDKPKALFVGAAPSMNDLDAEAKTACEWMLANVPGSLYASFADLEANAVDMSECKVIWWHFHVDGGVDGHDVFVAKAPEALAAKNQLRQFYENGGALFLTRYAVNLPSFIGATGDDEWTTPNNCWGQDEAAAELCGGPWTFRIFDGQNAHPLFQGLVAGDNPQEVYCTDAGYHITNSTAQYHIGTDWGGYDNHAAWEARTGATDPRRGWRRRCRGMGISCPRRQGRHHLHRLRLLRLVLLHLRGRLHRELPPQHRHDDQDHQSSDKITHFNYF